VDCLIVGGGPAGLSAAIRFKQLEKERGGEEKRVVVLEKGAEVGESGWFESGVGKESRKRAQCGSSHWLEDASRRVMDLAGMGGVENQLAVLARSVVHVEKESGPCDCGKGIAGRRL
jgi:protoporphyrinogen oxidase